MIVGVPKEIKLQEHRIGLTPESVKVLVERNHEVLVENNGGLEAGFTNEDYLKAGAKIIGGCCGTTPRHIRAMRNALEKSPISASYSADKHFLQLGRPWQETDKSKKRIKRSSLRKKNS